MDQKRFNYLVYWALKYYQVRMFADGESRTTQIGAARFFFSSLWNSTNNILITDELLDDLLNEEEIEVLAYQYRLVNDASVMLEIQDHYTQLVVRKLNYYAHSYYSWTLQPNESLTFWEYLIFTHQIELGIGLLSGVASTLTFMANQSQVASILGMPGIGILGWFGFYYYQWQRLQHHQLEITPKYIVNIHHQYKIWLQSCDDNEIPDCLMSYIVQNTGTGFDKMVLVYDRELISTKFHESLVQYCDLYGVKEMVIRKAVFPFCQTNEEKKLIDIYQQEIIHRLKGGSLKAAAQVLRWLKPIYELGLYTDMDRTLDLRNLPRTYAFKKPMIFNIDHQWERNDNQIKINSDAMMVIHVNDAQPLIRKIQNEIINAYIFRHPQHFIDDDVIKRLKWAYEVVEINFERFQQSLQEKKDGLTLRKELFNCVAEVKSILLSEHLQMLQDYKLQLEEDVVKQTTGDELLLRTLCSYIEEKIKNNSLRQITEYGFEDYHLNHRFHHKRDEEEQYHKDEYQRQQINIKREMIKFMDVKQEIVQESAKIIQRFFKVKMAVRQEEKQTQEINSDWELINKI